MAKYPLGGIRVIDFGWVWAGPFTTLLLGDMGAEIIKVESRRRVDFVRYFTPQTKGQRTGPDMSASFHSLHRNKLGITLDLANEEARRLTMQLVAVADVVVENYSPHVMRGWGLTYDTFRAVKTDVVMISLASAGQFGPLRDVVTYGPTLGALSGIEALVGYHHERPLGSQRAYTDPVAGTFGAFAVLAALRYRARTGIGQFIDLSQMDATATMLGRTMMDYIINEREAVRMGNKHAWAAPHGCYRCKGDDKWVSIAVTSEDDWSGLCRAMGDPAWARDARFANMGSRKENEDELDRIIQTWTLKVDQNDAMFRLQQQGVSCAATLNCRQIIDNAQFVSRERWVRHRYPATGEEELMPGLNWKLSHSPGGFYRPAPTLGGDRDYVFGDLLGMGRSEISALEEQQVIY